MFATDTYDNDNPEEDEHLVTSPASSSWETRLGFVCVRLRISAVWCTSGSVDGANAVGFRGRQAQDEIGRSGRPLAAACVTTRNGDVDVAPRAQMTGGLRICS